MREKKFCLVNEPWIRVITADAEMHEVSLMELFENAHIYRDLAGELPMQNVAVMRFLLAVLHTVFSRYDPDGQERTINEPEEALEAYCEVWEQEHFSMEPFREYFDKWSEKFWMIHPETPFYQVTAKEGEKVGTECSAAKMNGELFESSNKVKLFSNRSGKSKSELTLSEAARWILFLNSYDDCAAKNPSPKECWVSKLGITLAKGKNLFETLMLNFQAINIEEEECWTECIPSWERDQKKLEKLREIPWPDNPASLLSLQSRRIYPIYSENDTVTGYQIAAGDYFEARNCFIENMTIWSHVPAKKNESEYWKPQKYAASAMAWQEFPVLLALESDGRMPGIVSWIKYLQSPDVQILSKEKIITFEVCSVEYGSQTCGIAVDAHDQLSFHAELLQDTSQKWQKMIQMMITKTNDTAKNVFGLAVDINKAENGFEGENQKAVGERSREQFYYLIDGMFRNWLCSIDVNRDDIEEARCAWINLLRKEALLFAKELAFSAGETAFVGRSVNKTTYSTSKAYNTFIFRINRLLNIVGEE